MPRWTRVWLAAAWLAGALARAVSLGADEGDAGGRSVRGLAYAAPVADDPDAHTLDLYLPAAKGAKPPLLVFVPGHFWRDRSGERSLDPHFSRVLQGEGAAVALVRHRLAPAHRHPAAVRRRVRAVVDSGRSPGVTWRTRSTSIPRRRASGSRASTPRSSGRGPRAPTT